MIFTAEINIMPHKELLDPQGKAVENGLQKMKLGAIENVRIGKHIQLQVEANSEAEATQLVDEACKKLLCNRIMEHYAFELKAS